MSNAASAARLLTQAGISVIPIRNDGSKVPALPTWKEWQHRIPSTADLREWFSDGNGIAIIGGAVSGNLEVLDFDEPGLCDEFEEACRENGLDDLVKQLVRVGTPGGGDHLYFRCDSQVPGNQKLAWTTDKQIRIETRGEGGYALTFPTPGYDRRRGRADRLPTVTAEQRTALHAVARLFNEYVDSSCVVDAPRPKETGTGLRPGDDYNERGDVLELLQSHGWQIVGRRGAGALLKRPGKQGRGVSATWNAVLGAFYPFSSNAVPFESGSAYKPFAVYTLLEHGGDYDEAAKALAAQGYGDQRLRAGKTVSNRGFVDTVDIVDGIQDSVLWETPVLLPNFRPPAFPVEVLPSWLRRYVKAESSTTETPVDMPAMLTLATCAACVAHVAEIEAKPGWSEPLNLWTLTARPPASRKSAVFADVMRPVYAYERDENARRRPQIAEAEARRDILKEQLNRAKKEAGSARTQDERREMEARAISIAAKLAEMETSMPTPLRLTIDDVTPEKLLELLAEQGGRIGVMSPEGGVFDMMAGRYSNGTPNLDVYLKGHAGDGAASDRIGRKTVCVQNPALTMGLAVQPEVLRGLACKPHFRGRGLLARFLYSLPESNIGYRSNNAPEVPEEVSAAYDRGIRSLLTLRPEVGEDGQEMPHILRLHTEAQEVFKEFRDTVEIMLRPGEQLSEIPDWGGKLCGTIARIAGILHLAQHCGNDSPWRIEVSGKTMANAIKLADHLIVHAQHAFNVMGTDRVMEDAQAALVWLHQWCRKNETDRVTRREMQQGSRRFRKAEDTAPVLAILEDRGYVRKVEVEKGAAGRPPAPTYIVNPIFLRGEFNPCEPSTMSTTSTELGSGVVSEDETASIAPEGDSAIEWATAGEIVVCRW